jgi:hypothetical protein
MRRPVEALHARRKQLPDDPVASVLFIADAYSNGMTLAASPDAAAMPLLKSVCQKAAGATDPPVPEADEFCAEIFGLTGLLARLRPEEEAEFLKPLFARREKRLCVASESAFSRFDPIGAALRAMCQIEAIDHLPESDELREMNGMVVVTRNTTTPKFSPPDVLRRVPAGNGAPLPILWITVDASRSSEADTIQRVTTPVRLARLAEFVEGIPMAQSIAA